MLTKILALFGIGATAYAEVPPITTDDEHNAVYEKGNKLISPYMRLLDRDEKVTEETKRKLLHGIECHRAVIEYNPRNWASYWMIGKAYQALGDSQNANAAFKGAYQIKKENPDVARELASSYMELGMGDEAATVAKHAIAVDPDDAGLYANLALAYLIAGKNDLAIESIDKSLEMNPKDQISLAVKKVTEEVASGVRARPKTIRNLEK